jgi:hypothetical protein
MDVDDPDVPKIASSMRKPDAADEALLAAAARVKNRWMAGPL